MFRVRETIIMGSKIRLTFFESEVETVIESTE